MRLIGQYQSHLRPIDDLTDWGRVTHVCVSKLGPHQRKAIILTNAEL